jgi:D-arginine dehydrogenase
MSDFDIAIVGAGIAGASIAAEIGARSSVLLLEAESQPGYHATGRSAAFWSETYGGPIVQPLTSLSKSFLANPPADFTDRPLLRQRGALHLGQAADTGLADAMLADFSKSSVSLGRLCPNEIAQHLPNLNPGWTEALWEPECCDIDVAALHAGYLKKARNAGAQLHCHAPLTGAKFVRGEWQIEANGQFTAKKLINAAGAWADQVASLAGAKAIGITPYRRTVLQLAVDPPASSDLPLVVGLDGSFYFKPEAGGKLWLSPHDEGASEPCDAAPEELDIARAIARFQQVVDWPILRLEQKWAGLRSFAPDRAPVIGFDPHIPEFFWAAGQGGFGIQTAPAIATMAAALLSDRVIPTMAADPRPFSPARFC